MSLSTPLDDVLESENMSNKPVNNTQNVNMQSNQLRPEQSNNMQLNQLRPEQSNDMQPKQLQQTQQNNMHPSQLQQQQNMYQNQQQSFNPQLNNINQQQSHQLSDNQNTQSLNDNQFVDAVLNEFEKSSDTSKNQNTEAQNYAINNVHVPPPYLPETKGLLKAEPTQIYNNETFNIQNNKSNSIIDFFIKYKYQFYSIIIFMVLFIISSLHHVNRLIFSFMPYLLLENGQISIMGILLKSLIATILYSIILFVI